VRVWIKIVYVLKMVQNQEQAKFTHYLLKGKKIKRILSGAAGMK